MCITFIGVNPNSKYKFVILFNRDEFFNRPTRSIGFHNEEKYKDELFYPLDCISGGTFLCLNVKNGNFGLLLNNNFYHIPYNPNINMKRAEIAIDFCKLQENDKESFDNFFAILNKNKKEYNGFNFVCGNMRTKEVFYFTNNEGNKINSESEMNCPMLLNDNLIGVSNYFIINDQTVYNEKVQYGKKMFKNILENNYEDEDNFINDLFLMMEDDNKLINKNKNIELDKVEKSNILTNLKLKHYLVSSIFVKDSIEDIHFEYGTRHTIAITLDNENKLKVFEHCDEIKEIKLAEEDLKCEMNKKTFTLEKREKSNMKSFEFNL